jgi:hypothetical protein
MGECGEGAMGGVGRRLLRVSMGSNGIMKMAARSY